MVIAFFKIITRYFSVNSNDTFQFKLELFFKLIVKFLLMDMKGMFFPRKSSLYKKKEKFCMKIFINIF